MKRRLPRDAGRVEKDARYDEETKDAACADALPNDQVCFNHSSHQLLNVTAYCKFPCNTPVNSGMRSREARAQTFLNRKRNWDRPPFFNQPFEDKLVDAGFYSIGERDKMRCWYCNGGLQNWKWDDNPWEEHAKWFPLCEYVLQQKGLNYVQTVCRRFPEVQRPKTYRTTTSSEVQSLREHLQSPNNSPLGSPLPLIIDPQKEMRERQYADISSTFTDISSLTDLLQQNSDDEPKRDYINESLAAVCEANLSPAEQLKRLEEFRRCKACTIENACVVVMPCGHLVCCAICSEQSAECPVCLVRITDKIHICDTGRIF